MYPNKNKSKFSIGVIISLVLLLLFIGIIAIYSVLQSENAVVVHPRGIVSKDELELMIVNISLMLLIIIPTLFLLLYIVWKYCIKNEYAKYEPNHTFGPIGELIMWGIPSIIVAIMGFITWEKTHQLNPYKPLTSENKPLNIQVVALDWKWLFIYPDQGIATLNYFFIPEQTPIHLRLTADGSPMNSFWIPQLSGQIYSMTGMSTQLHLMADGPGEYQGRAVEINGEGYADMTFPAKSVTRQAFEAWIEEVQKSNVQLTEASYAELIKPFIDKSIIFFSNVEKDLYDKIINKYMYPAEPVL